MKKIKYENSIQNSRDNKGLNLSDSVQNFIMKIKKSKKLIMGCTKKHTFFEISIVSTKNDTVDYIRGRIKLEN